MFGSDVCPDVAKSSCDVKSLTYCDLQCLNLEGLKGVLKLYYEFSEEFETNIINELAYNIREGFVDPDEKDVVYAPAITLPTICEERLSNSCGGGGSSIGGGDVKSGCSGIEGGSMKGEDNTLDDLESNYYSNEDNDADDHLLTNLLTNVSVKSPLRDKPSSEHRRNSLLVVEPKSYLEVKAFPVRKRYGELSGKKSKSVDLSVKEMEKKKKEEMKTLGKSEKKNRNDDDEKNDGDKDKNEDEKDKNEEDKADECFETTISYENVNNFQPPAKSALSPTNRRSAIFIFKSF